MSRHIDPEVAERILQAARKLWHKGGEKALSMRAVAKAAGTNTPAVYRRFRNREELLRALVTYYQQEFFKVLQPCRSLQEVGQAYLDFVLGRPREYLLMNSGLIGRVSKTRPNLDFVVERTSEWLGGAPGEHTPLVLALWALAHGAAMLKISGSVQEENFPTLREAFSQAIDILVANEKKLRQKDPPTHPAVTAWTLPLR
jgi:AcrR family transcriptional regulator